jgi:poly(A) polymerase
VDSDGRVRFQGHAELGAQQTVSALRRLRYSAEVVSRAARLVERHMVRLPDNSRSARRFAHKHRDVLPGLLHVMLADREAARGPAASAKGRERYRHAVARVVAEIEALPEAPPLLRGEDVMQLLDVPPGPWVGAALSFVAESQAVGDIADRHEAERAVTAWWTVQRSRWSL